MTETDAKPECYQQGISCRVNWFKSSPNAKPYKCPKCGAEGIMDDAFFCKKCGHFEDS